MSIGRGKGDSAKEFRNMWKNKNVDEENRGKIGENRGKPGTAPVFLDKRRFIW